MQQYILYPCYRNSFLRLYGLSPTRDQYFKDQEEQAQSWFEKVRNMARNEGIAELKTESFPYVTSVIGFIIDYAPNKDIDLIVIGTKGRTGLKRFLMGSVANAIAGLKLVIDIEVVEINIPYCTL